MAISMLSIPIIGFFLWFLAMWVILKFGDLSFEPTVFKLIKKDGLTYIVPKSFGE